MGVHVRGWPHYSRLLHNRECNCQHVKVMCVEPGAARSTLL